MTTPDLDHERVPPPRDDIFSPAASGITMDDPAMAGRILVVCAHPDDVDFGVAGSVAAWTDAGADVIYCIVTDGDAGGSDRSMPRHEMATLRRKEQTDAAAVVGVTGVVFLAHPDGRVVPSIELRRDISRVIRQYKPDRVVCQSPDRLWDRLAASHPDHLAAGEAAVCAVYPDARNPFAHPELLEEGLEPHTVPEIWLMASAGPNRAVDVTATFDRKIAALRSHKSQGTDGDHIEPMIRGWLTAMAGMAGLGEGRMAEAFRVVASP